MRLPALLDAKKSFIFLQVAKKGSGKTENTIKLLTDKRALKGIFDRIIIICPTFLLQDTWKKIDKEGIFVYLEFSPELLEQIMKQQTEDKSVKTLLILDDNGEDILKGGCNKLFHKMVANSRHINLSILWNAQRLSQIPTYVRANMDIMAMWPSSSTREREICYNEVSILRKTTFMNMFNYGTQEPFSCFVCKFEDSQMKYYKNFDEIINNDTIGSRFEIPCES